MRRSPSRRALQLDLAEWDAVDEEQQVWAAVLAALDDRELVDNLEGVVLWVLPVDQADQPCLLLAARATLHEMTGNARQKQLMELAVVLNERW